MKKSLAAFMAILTVFMCFGICARAGVSDIGDIAAQPDGVEETASPTDPATPDDPYENDNTDEYAEMYLVSYWNVASPHIFVYFKNLTKHEIQIGAYTCPAGRGCSVATLGVSTADGDGTGIYYNMELYRIGQDGKFPMVIILKKIVSKDDLQNVTDFILSHNRWDFFIFNCSWFAAKCWNLGGGAYLVPITMFPTILRIEMLFHHPIDKKEFELDNAERDEVFRQVGEGDLATLKVASDKSMG
jgi:hypothetical protein